jgi:3-methyl-2-oxobutanoate hydroxymethyltransferase
MVCLGYDSTISVSVREILHHTKAVSRAVKHALVVADMPFGSYQTAQLALRNARRLVQEGGAEAIKLEGGARVLTQVKTLVKSGIPVMGHVGMTPQTASEHGGYKVQGKSKKDAEQILKEAKQLEQAGVFSIVLECVPFKLGQRITKAIKVPTIGIGAGPKTDGQVLVLHDILGFESIVKPRFVRKYSNLDRIISRALLEYKQDVLTGKFPSLNESYG